MNSIERFYREGYVRINLKQQPIFNCSIMCVDKGTWYTFNIDEIVELDDGTFDIISRTLIKIDDKRVN